VEDAVPERSEIYVVELLLVDLFVDGSEELIRGFSEGELFIQVVLDGRIEGVVILWSEPSADLRDLVDLDSLVLVAGDDVFDLLVLLLQPPVSFDHDRKDHTSHIDSSHFVWLVVRCVVQERVLEKVGVVAVMSSWLVCGWCDTFSQTRDDWR
jgi:hypothetical protein